MKIELRMIFCLVLIHSLRTIGSGIRTMIISVAILIAVRASVLALLVLPYQLQGCEKLWLSSRLFPGSCVSSST